MIDVGALIADVVALYATEAERARCTLSVEAPRVVGHWDRDRLEQTITNLLKNALKFAPGKSIRIRLEALGDRARLSVHDEGIGIPAEYLQRIFGRFERTLVGNYGGLGLGLHICRTNIEAMGGHHRRRERGGARRDVHGRPSARRAARVSRWRRLPRKRRRLAGVQPRRAPRAPFHSRGNACRRGQSNPTT